MARFKHEDVEDLNKEEATAMIAQLEKEAKDKAANGGDSSSDSDDDEPIANRGAPNGVVQLEIVGFQS